MQDKQQRKAKLGDRVEIQYRGLLHDGTEFCQSGRDQTVSLCIGERGVFPGVEDALIGLVPGSKTTVTLDAKDGYGDYDVDKIFSLPIEKLQHPLPTQGQASVLVPVKPQRGTAIRVQDGEGRSFDAVVTAVDKKVVTIDTNHPLAGKRLTYEVTLVRLY